MATPSTAPYGSPMPPAPPSRPLGVSILAILVGLYGVLFVLAGILALAGGAVLGALTGFHFAGLSLLALGAIILILGILNLASALGLWHLRLWALVLALIVTFLEVVGFALSSQILGLVIALIIFVYLLAVHRHFH